MYIEYNTPKTKFSQAQKNIVNPTALLVLDLPLLIRKLNERNSANQVDLSTIILLKSFDKQIVLAAFREGATLRSFQSNDSTTFQIIQGRLMFHSSKESRMLENGQFLQINDNVKYSISSDKETVFLITFFKDNLRAS